MESGDYVSICDTNGQVVPDSHKTVTLDVTGAAELLPGGKRPAEAGIAPFMIRAKARAGRVRIYASADGLPMTEAVIRSVTPP